MLRRLLHIIYLRAAAIWRFLYRTDSIIFALFLVLATILWWVRAMSTQREAQVEIPIVYTDAPTDVQFLSPLPGTLCVTVRDLGRHLRDFPTPNTRLEIDISNYIKSGDGTVHISAETLRGRLKDILPGSMVIIHVRPEHINTAYQHQSYVVLPVHSSVTWSASPHYQTIKDYVNPSRVRAYGSRRFLATLSTITTDTLTLTDVQDTVSRRVALVAPQGVRLVPDSVTVTCLSEQFTECVFRLPIEVVGCGDKVQVKLFPCEADVIARVGISHFADVKADDFSVFSALTDSTASALKVEAECSNPYVTQVRTDPTFVEYIVEQHSK